MSKTLWHTLKLEVPKEMVNITKNDKVVVKNHSLKQITLVKQIKNHRLKQYLVILINLKLLVMVKNGKLKN